MRQLKLTIVPLNSKNLRLQFPQVMTQLKYYVNTKWKVGVRERNKDHAKGKLDGHFFHSLYSCTIYMYMSFKFPKVKTNFRNIFIPKTLKPPKKTYNKYSVMLQKTCRTIAPVSKLTLSLLNF